MSDKMPAEVFPPGEFLKEELDARGWTQTDLAEILGRPPRVVNEIITGKRAVSPETAKGLGEALGTSAELWMNLESSYQLWRLAKKGGNDPNVSRRAHLFSRFPIKELTRRLWIEPSDNIDVVERRVMDFFALSSIGEEPRMLAAARKSSYGERSIAEVAWLCRAKRLSHAVDASRYSDSSLQAALGTLRALRRNAEDIRRIPKVLADAGVRLLAVEAVPGTRVDGACFWLNKQSPVVVLSLRYDRLDAFWFTLMHELFHVWNRDAQDEPLLDVDLIGDGTKAAEKPEAEREADSWASDFLVPADEFENFMNRTRPFYALAKVRGFSARINVHPGLVVGQLQYRGEIPYSHFRSLLGSGVRQVIKAAALTDGWGQTVRV